MFSRKTMNKTIASVLIILMCMALVPFIGTRHVRAAGPDTEHYTRVDMRSRPTVYRGSETVTFEFDTEETMSYRIFVDESSQKATKGADSVTIEVYDKDEKFIKSTDKSDLTVELEGGTYYYVVFSGCDQGYDVRFTYSFDVDIKVKEPGSNSYELQSHGGYTWGRLHGGYWDRYTVVDGSDIKAELNVRSLPSGKKLNYSWYKFKQDSEEVEAVGTKNKALDLKLNKQEGAYYVCKVSSTDGLFDTSIIFNLESIPSFTFENGKSAAYQIMSFKPGEERKFKYPKTVYGGDAGDSASYYLGEQSGSWKFTAPKEEPIVIPAEWNSTAFFCSKSIGSSSVYYYVFGFVFEDGDGEKVKCGQTYHIDKEVGKGGYEQVIYSFTPSKTGTYVLDASNITMDYAALAVFDPNRKVIGENIGRGVNSEIGFSEKDENTRLEIDLTAGKTYHIAFPVMNFGLACDFTISEKTAEPTAAPATATPTPKAAPTAVAPTTAPTTATPTPSSTDEQELSFEDFVERLYVVALGRDSEPEGKAYWCEHVGNGELNGAQCANEFLFSAEFINRKLSDEDFLKVLYKTFFDRDAANDPDGFNYWLNALKTEGRDTVISGFINSPEWCNVCALYGVRSGAEWAKATIASKNATAFATRLYTECLGREPEEDGLAYWSLGLTNQEFSGTQAAMQFFYSAEFLDAKHNDDEYVNRLYKTFMGREPDEDGKAYWLSILKDGTSRDDVFMSFSACPEFDDICKKYAIMR